MNIAIVFANLNEDSFTNQVVKEIKYISDKKNNNVKIIDLYKDGFDPVLRKSDFVSVSKEVIEYQEKLNWAEKIVFVYPLWWGQMPAILKGFLDKVITKGFAFNVGKDGIPFGMLKKKKVQFIVNLGLEKESQEKNGMLDAITKSHMENNFIFCGVKEENCNITFFDGISNVNEEVKKAYLDTLGEIV